MTGNQIILYKAPWNFSTLYQPYFMSDTARDSYFAELPSLNVTPTNGNVNIHFDYNLECELVIAADYTIAVDFNFCKIIYNNRTFYSNILDCKQLSVGYSKIQVRRHIISEKTNFFQYFERFQIGRATFSEQFTYGSNTKFFIPKFRTSIQRIAPAMDFHTLNAAGAEVKSRTYYRPFYLLFLDSSLSPQRSYLYGETIQFLICIIPANIDGYTFTYPGINNVQIKYRSEGYFTEGEPNYGHLETYTQAFSYSFLDKLSPNIKAIELIYMPVDLDQNMLPYVWKSLSLDGIDNEKFLILDTTHLRAVDSEGNDKSEFDEYFSFEIPVNADNIFTNVTLIVGFDENRIVFPAYEKTKQAGSIEVEVQYLMDINGSSYQVRVIGDSTSIKPNVDTVKTFPFYCDYSYLLDQSSNFDAQNKYYSAMTQNAAKGKTISGFVQAGEEFALGVTQIGFGQGMGAGGQAASNSMGVGNIIRSIGSTLQMVNDVSVYQNQRALYRMNEKSKPDQLISGNNSYSRGLEWQGQISYIIEKPFTEDFNSWLDDKSTYGVECDIHRDSIDINEFVVDNKFFLMGIPVKKDNAVLTVQEYNEMYNLIHGGCRYFIVDETT